MSDISVLGLGLMGSALARSLIAAGHRVTVWNRSSEKSVPLVKSGAISAESVAAAVAASPVVLACVDNYDTTRAFLDAPEPKLRLPGRIFVQLSTGMPREARESETWFNSKGAGYLDGAILCGPVDIGTPGATILYSGQRGSFERCHDLLKALAGDTRFVGEKVGSAAAIDFAWLSELFGVFAGAAHGAILCESEGVDLDLYASVFAENDIAREMIGVIGKGAFANPGATLQVWNAALRRIRNQARDAGINSEVPDFIAGLLDRAEAAGLQNEHIAAMVKALRRVNIHAS